MYKYVMILTNTLTDEYQVRFVLTKHKMDNMHDVETTEYYDDGIFYDLEGVKLNREHSHYLDDLIGGDGLEANMRVEFYEIPEIADFGGQ